MADSSAVKRVIENLISNAIKHSSGDVTVQLTILKPAKELKENDLPFLFDLFIKLNKMKYRFKIIYCDKSNDKDGWEFVSRIKWRSIADEIRMEKLGRASLSNLLKLFIAYKKCFYL